MARTVNIGFNIGTGNSIENLKKIRTELAGIREEVNKPLNLNVQVSNNAISEINKLEQAMESMRKNANKPIGNITNGLSSELKSIEKILEVTSRRINEMSDGKLRMALEQAYIQGKFLRDTIARTSQDASRIRLTGLSVDVDEATNKLQGLINLSRQSQIGFSGANRFNSANSNVSMPSNISNIYSEINKLQQAIRGFDTTPLSTNMRNTLNLVSTDVGNLSSRLRTVGINTSNIQAYESELERLRTQLGGVGTTAQNTNTQMLSLAKSFIYFRGLMLFKQGISNFMDLEDSVYNLGVVAQKSNESINGIKQSLIDLSSINQKMTTSEGDAFLPLVASANDLAQAMNEVMRTGKTYQEAYNLVTETVKLAVASGDDLEGAVSIINKLFVALDIGANNVDSVNTALTQLHATSIYTATDLAGMGESAKQWVGALGVLTSTTSKSGEALNQYKLDLMELGTGFSGILANMGRASEQQGEQLLCPYVARVA